jgi:hypothetical protein
MSEIFYFVFLDSLRTLQVLLETFEEHIKNKIKDNKQW